MGLNPAIIFLSLSIWSALLGFVGLIIAVPLTTLLLSYYDKYIERRDPPAMEQGTFTQAGTTTKSCQGTIDQKELIHSTSC